MEKDSLKEATCELIAEARKTNVLLGQLIDGRRDLRQGDRDASTRWWFSLPKREEIYLTQAIAAEQAWKAALEWERYER